MDKDRVAEILSEIGTLLELKGENPFKTRAYENAARALEGLGEPLEKLVAENRLGDVKGIADSLNALASLAIRRGHYAEAGARLRQYAALYGELGDRRGMFSALTMALHLAMADRRHERASRLLGALQALGESTGQTRRSLRPYADLESVEQALRESLGTGPFEAAWEAGRSLAWPDVAELILRE